MPDEEERLKSDDYPFSPADWIMFLNWEIFDRRMQSLVAAGMVAIGILAFLGGIVFISIGIIWFGIVGCILLTVAVFLVITSLYRGNRPNQNMRGIKEIRDDIIYGVLTNHEDILKRCEELGIFKHEND